MPSLLWLAMDKYDDFEQNRVKHLEMIQAVVTRLSNEGFLIKGWTVTLAGVVAGLAINSESWSLALLGCLPTLAFWALDAIFLRDERLFRDLGEYVRKHTSEVEPFYMGATSPDFVALVMRSGKRGAGSRLHAFWRPALRYLFGSILIALIAIAITIGASAGDSHSELSGRCAMACEVERRTCTRHECAPQPVWSSSSQRRRDRARFAPSGRP
jgi:hypothetical protein